MFRRTSLLAPLALLIGSVAALACSASSRTSGFESGADSADSGGPTGPLLTTGPSTDVDASTSGSDECKKMDIVFVVDNSFSMDQEQANLAANFPKFISVINDYTTKTGDSLDYRIATTTSDDKADRGKFTVARGAGAPGGCTPGPARPWLERNDGNVAGFFGCRAQAGTDGSIIERPLENMLLSVTTAITSGTNVSSGSSFLRDDALLAFIILTDEDEGSDGSSGGSARPMSAYAPAFDVVKKERGRWAAAVIAGETKCESAFGSASEAKRLKGFINDVGANGVFASICTGDLTEGLTKALATFNQACKNFPGVK